MSLFKNKSLVIKVEIYCSKYTRYINKNDIYKTRYLQTIFKSLKCNIVSIQINNNTR